MAVSASVLTPYDFLSYALIIAAVIAALSGQTLWTAVLTMAAVATRESGLLVIAVVLASCVLANPGADTPRHHWALSWRSSCRAVVTHLQLRAAAIAGLATYAVLKIALPGKGGGLTLFQHIDVRTNLTTRSLWALVVAAALVLAGRWVVRPASAALRTRRLVLWVLALPYLVIIGFGGIWTEAPRLVMPLVIGEALLAISSTTFTPRTESGTPEPKEGIDMACPQQTETSKSPTWAVRPQARCANDPRPSDLVRAILSDRYRLNDYLHRSALAQAAIRDGADCQLACEAYGFSRPEDVRTAQIVHQHHERIGVK